MRVQKYKVLSTHEALPHYISLSLVLLADYLYELFNPHNLNLWPGNIP